MRIDKHKIFEACLQQQTEEVNNFEARVNSMKSDVDTNEQSASQSEERTAGKLELLSNYEKELTFSRMEMNHLKALKPSITNTKVEPGAIVMTDQLNFYISIPINKIEVDGETFVGISTNAPIYTVMKDKVKGDTFKFNETTYTILNVY
jgi:hypothetical protein